MGYDSAQGRFNGDISTDGTNLMINGKKVIVNQERNPEDIPWAKQGAVFVAECTGIFRDKDKAAAHLKGGAKKVVISAPSKTAPMYVMSCNTDTYEESKEKEVISNASCTTNCLAPVTKVLHDAYGIKHGLMTTVHAATATQVTVDGPHNIIPSSTGAAIAIGSVIKSLDGKLNGMCFRVPVICGSVVDATFVLEKETTFEDVCSMMMGKTLIKVISWYDNEWGYSCRLLDLCAFTAQKDGIMQKKISSNL